MLPSGNIVATFLVLIASLSVSVFSQPPAESPVSVKGLYIRSTRYTGYTVQLNDDGTYWRQYFTDCCEKYLKVPGRFVVSQSKITFTPDDPKSGYDPFVMEWLRWGDRIYLLEIGKLNEFAAAINLGEEPRDWIASRREFSLRRGDEAKSVNGLPTVPDSIKALILAPLIEPAISSSKVVEDRIGKGIDKGSDGGVLPGMCFVPKAEDPFFGGELFCAETVERNTSVLRSSSSYWRASPHRKGDRLINRMVKPK